MEGDLAICLIALNGKPLDGDGLAYVARYGELRKRMNELYKAANQKEAKG
jgi:hypothetical protein